jgi:hypothetical protein
LTVTASDMQGNTMTSTGAFYATVVTSLALFVVVAVAASGGRNAGTKSAVYMDNVTACSTPCENGTYEVISCSPANPKLCRGTLT